MKKVRRRPDVIAAAAWQDFYLSPNGRAAIALLMQEYGFFSAPAPGADLVRATGQRDVLVRINQLINRKPDAAPHDSAEDDDILERIMMRS